MITVFNELLTQEPGGVGPQTVTDHVQMIQTLRTVPRYQCSRSVSAYPAPKLENPDSTLETEVDQDQTPWKRESGFGSWALQKKS